MGAIKYGRFAVCKRVPVVAGRQRKGERPAIHGDIKAIGGRKGHGTEGKVDPECQGPHLRVAGKQMATPAGA